MRRPFEMELQFFLVLMTMAWIGLLGGCKTMSMPDLSQMDFGLQKTTVTIKRENSSVNVRPSPSTEQSPVARLKGGDQLEMVGEQGDWLNVRFFDTAGNSRYGWINKYLVEGYEQPAGQRGAAATAGESLAPAPAGAPVAQPKAAAQEAAPAQQLPRNEKISPL